ncbi:MAG TPA: DUF6798 domain-containing protein [Spirochaetota bacterium]|nr:DUF6798 domain-containing protein [Spirochaetota bacterium]
MALISTCGRALREFIGKRSVFLTVFIILILNLLLKNILGVNENVVLAEARHFGDPSWIPNDWFLNQYIGYRLLFNAIFGQLAMILPLYLVSIAGRLVIYFLFAIVIEKISRTLKIHLALIIPALVLFVSFQSIVAREWMIGGVETKSFAYICALGALVALAHRRYRPMFLLTGLAASFHILVGIYAAFSLGVAILLTFNSHSDRIKEIFLAVPYALMTAVPAIYAVGQYLYDSASVDALKAATIYVIERNPHHTFPEAWTRPWVARFSASCMLFAGILAFSRRPARRVFAAYGLGSAVLFCAGLVLYHSGNYAWLKLYWFRHPDVIIPLLGFFLLAALMSEPLKSESAPGTERKTIINKPALQKTALVIALLLSTAGMVKSAYVFSRHIVKIAGSERPFYLAHLEPNLREALLWIKGNTPADAMFLVSPAIDEFYISAERAMFVSFKHSPQTDSDNIEWYNRILLLNNGKIPAKRGFKMVREIDQSFYDLETATINEIAKRYSLDYYLGKSERKRPYRIAYDNDNYTLYRLRQ